MKIARLLADEGAELRHSEIMELYVERASDRPYDAAFRNLIETGGSHDDAAIDPADGKSSTKVRERKRSRRTAAVCESR